MKDWVTKTISECCEILDNKRIPLNEETRAKIPGTIPYYGANGVQGYIDKYLFDEDLILIAEDGGYFDEYATRPIAYRVSGKSWVNNHAHVLRAKAEYDQSYIFYSLVHKNILKFILGGTRAKLNQSELRSIEISLPTRKPEQSAIARILSTVDKAIEKTEQLIAKYERIKTGLMQDLLTKGIDEQGRIRSESTHRFKDSPLGRIPVEWEVCSLKQLSMDGLSNGLFKKPSLVGSGCRLVNVVDLYQPFGIDLRLVERFNASEDERKRFAVKPGDLFFTRSSLVLSGIAHCNLVRTVSEPTVFESHVMKLTPDQSKVVPEYLALWCRSAFARRFLMNRARQVTMATISQPDILPMPVVLPPKEEQYRIVHLLDSTDRAINSARAMLGKEKWLRTGLLQDLLSGRVRVPEEMIGANAKRN